jgi:hypothetical protein
MNDYEKTIKDLQDRVKSLEGRLTPCNGAVAAEPKNWQPVGGSCWITSNGGIVPVTTSINCEQATLFGARRPTQHQAERAAIEMRKFNRLLALRDELCGDVMVDWTNFKQEKFYLSHDEENKRWHIRSSFMSKASVAYFTTLESAQRACDMLNSGEAEL